MRESIIHKKFDVIVVGGGISGICASIAAARHGAKTALLHDRPVLGGNAGSEVRMHICGANCHGDRPDARETGILEEILLENRKRNPNHSFSILDTVFWEKVHFQENLEMYLNTHMYDAKTSGNEIKAIIARQITTEKTFEMEAAIYIDCSGDGLLASLAGAEYMTGREGKSVFGENLAPDQSDHITMGNTILFESADMGYPVKFERPFWAYEYKEEDLMGHSGEITSGYWWIELGGKDLDIIKDGEEIRDELLKVVYGIWDHIKNGGDHGAQNHALEWVGFLPGKRESRRVSGDYVLIQEDIMKGKVFEDAVAYGGWHIDIHDPNGFQNKLKDGVAVKLDDVYTIPYRCLYSKNIKNLMMGGRTISTSHIAFGSARVMGTCAVVSQAAGTAAAMAADKGLIPSQILNHMDELQSKLLKDDCYIPGLANTDLSDFAKTARISCSSALENGPCRNVANGAPRNVKGKTNSWISGKMQNASEWVSLEFDGQKTLSEVHLVFDSDLSKEIMISLSEWVQNRQEPGIPKTLVKDYKIIVFNDGLPVHTEEVRENHLRHRIHKFSDKILCNKIMIEVTSTNGCENARIFEIRAY